MNAIKLLQITLLCALLGFASQTYGDPIYLGLAKADITPPTGGNTTGYSSAKPTNAVHDPISAKVMVLSSSETTVAIVSWELCIFNSPRLFEETPALGVDRLLVLNTHTHAGPNLNQDDFPSSENPWRKTVEDRILEAVKEAKANQFRAHFAASEGNIQLGYNRLVRQPGGYAVTQFENPDRIPKGPVDPTVSVIRITDDTGKIRVIWVGYACHPVVLGPKNRQISADYPGVMCREVERELGDDSLCVFIQGGCGDINPLIMARTGDPERDFPLVERMGILLSEEVLGVVKGMETQEGKSESFACDAKVFEAAHRFESGKTVPVSVTSMLINNEIGIVSMPGEPFHKFQVDLRKNAGLPHTLFFGYCSSSPADWPSYIPDLESAAHGGYGASDTTKSEVGTGERLLNQGLVMLYEMRGRLLNKPQRNIRD